ncbi:hypothetical protein ABZV31_35590 [Streptomyces sp. NPDC005202]|uniref:nSTAND1 domain-containing NTPase n=1 Tax=Streptomyces sp. NPDC005202 TaxID=3157021 RepID=UPI0033A2C0A7
MAGRRESPWDPSAGPVQLMAHARLEAWRRRRGRALTLRAYAVVGGLHGAIGWTAEEAYARLTPAQADLARRILLRLITAGEGSPDTRRPVARGEFDFGAPADTATVLERLARARLLTLDQDTVERCGRHGDGLGTPCPCPPAHARPGHRRPCPMRL